jgi:hypothetical protein
VLGLCTTALGATSERQAALVPRIAVRPPALTGTVFRGSSVVTRGRLSAAGWTVLHVTAEDMRHPARLLLRIRVAIARLQGAAEAR